MTPDTQDLAQDLRRTYETYIECLNLQAWDRLGLFVAENVRHNGRPFGLSGYKRMLEEDFRAIPDLRFNIDILAVSPPIVACRLMFDCTPVGDLFDLKVDGRRVRFGEHVFYRFEGGLIEDVWSIIDQAAIAQQLAGSATDSPDGISHRSGPISAP